MLKKRVMPWVVPVCLLFAWQLASSAGILPPNVLPSPVAVVKAAWGLTQSGQLFDYIGASTKRALIGFLVGGGIGFGLGLFTGLSTKAESLLDSTVQMIRNVPHLALIPIVILWFGIGEEAKLFLVALGTFFPIYLNTFHGIRSVDRALIEMGEVYGLKGTALFWHMILPGALPSILVGVRYALGVTWVTLIVAETIASNSGIGYMAMNAREFMQLDVVVLSIVLYALLGKLSDWLAKIAEQRLLKWHPSYQK
ncbi:aliphatic sulfonate ABC transporter permease SsuC [Weizmannia coagulans]|jgi:sulfonate transport system permease protein|uniref:ABC transporter integral membrane protein n=2 Tax=Heyndrickxia TaxID=2837504 RepID=A0AAN0WA30_HEYCO|nr:MULTISPECIES: aliphatic sulfonate ABC transporter permease SsuC [Heyndrickxia]AJO21330.1 ABC transporter integral membrane protein [Heyndrickxia coagulans]AKN53040.1 Alkanesulfonates transport system permease protein [Heyndrickxia coagulans]APB37400.1 alkanesulfonate transporter permease subunit [Heyndrickxia coagulans]ATW81940.1 alkanesulfonate transporter permease subunit [Heyndrickxia coagulans]AVD57380.1 aliphatic sulfonate ABC transporter permease SsuC [Heyndrickxia coagulans]